MIEDESEPSYYDINSSSSTSSVFSDSEIIDINYRLGRRKHSLSLQNISTPLPLPLTKRCISDYNVVSLKKPRRNKYAHVESKVKKYIQDSESQFHESKERRLRQEEETRKALQLSFDEKQDKTPEFYKTTVFAKLPPSQNLRRSTLFKISPSIKSTLNTPRVSIFGNDSTCLTIDIQDELSLTPKNLKDEFIIYNKSPSTTQDPFLIKPSAPLSFINETSTSDQPLLESTSPVIRNTRKSVKRFFEKFLNCPNMAFLKECKYFKHNTNKVYPDYKIPLVTISRSSSKEEDSDSGNQSDVPVINNKKIRHSRVNFKQEFTTNQEFQLEEIVQCADELTDRINTFKILAQEFLNKNYN